MSLPKDSEAYAAITGGISRPSKSRTSFHVIKSDYELFQRYCRKKGVKPSELVNKFLADANRAFAEEFGELKSGSAPKSTKKIRTDK